MASTSCCYDPEVFCNLLDDNMALSKCSAAVGSTTSVPEDTNCVIFECKEAVGGFSDEFTASVCATHAEKPKGVTSELLKNIWRIDDSTVKRTIEITTQLNRQDVNSKLSQNFGTNDRMLRYRRPFSSTQRLSL